MDFWIAAILLILSLVGIVLLWRAKRKKTARRYAAGIAVLAVLAVVSAVYLALALLLLNGIN